MTVELGLRARKKQQTRLQIAQTANRLFKDRGFDAVTVAEIARAADVSEVTVFNYFPTKEDLFYGSMQFFEEQLLAAVRERPSGESALATFRRALLESSKNLNPPERADFIRTAADNIGGSPALQAREQQIVARYTQELAAMLANEVRARPDDVEAAGVAAGLMGVHRGIVAFVRAEVIRGRTGPALARAMRAQAIRAFARLEAGLGDYAVKRA
jgi:AcrR family transcriptional regulator